MKKTFLVLGTVLLLTCTSCSKNQKPAEVEVISPTVPHQWYYFSGTEIKETDKPENTPEVMGKPWTEATRISSAASLIPSKENRNYKYSAFAILNKVGLICFDSDNFEISRDISIFTRESADSLVFSDGCPIFYLYRSTFFSNDLFSNQNIISEARPFLVLFNQDARIFFPLVSYKNLNLDNTDQVTKVIWNGSKWVCSAKKQIDKGVEFSYFFWEPQIPLANLNPAMGQETFLFKSMTEEEFKKVGMPKSFLKAPAELKSLLKSIPDDFPFFVCWRDESGTSGDYYFQEGNDDEPLDARGLVAPLSKYNAVIFKDGTTYASRSSDPEKPVAFRLPKLPESFTYGEFCISGDTLYVSWEESDFYVVKRAGFLKVNLADIFKLS